MFLSRANGLKVARGNSFVEMINSSSIVQASATRVQIEVSFETCSRVRALINSFNRFEVLLSHCGEEVNVFSLIFSGIKNYPLIFLNLSRKHRHYVCDLQPLLSAHCLMDIKLI